MSKKFLNHKDLQLIFITLLIVVNLIIFESNFNRLVLTLIYVILTFLVYIRRINKNKKEKLYFSIELLIITIVIFKFAIKNGNIIYLSLGILSSVTVYNIIAKDFKQKEVGYINILIVILALISMPYLLIIL